MGLGLRLGLALTWCCLKTDGDSRPRLVGGGGGLAGLAGGSLGLAAGGREPPSHVPGGPLALLAVHAQQQASLALTPQLARAEDVVGERGANVRALLALRLDAIALVDPHDEALVLGLSIGLGPGLNIGLGLGLGPPCDTPTT